MNFASGMHSGVPILMYVCMRKRQKRPILRQKRPMIRQKRPHPEVCMHSGVPILRYAYA